MFFYCCYCCDAGYGQLQLSPNITTTPLQLSVCSSINSCPYSETKPVLYTSDLMATLNPGENHLASSISLVLEQAALLPENSYRFKLTMTNRQGQVGFSEIDIQTESLPSSGRLETSPLVGVPLLTLFTSRALGWTDKVGDAPFFYRFGFSYICADVDRSFFEYSSSKCVQWLSGLSEDNSLSYLLPAIPDCLEVELLVQVMDRNGAIRNIAYNTTTENKPSVVETDSPLAPVNETINMFSLLTKIEAALVTSVTCTEALARLTSVLWSVHIDQKAIVCSASHTMVSPTFKFTNSDVINIKIKVLKLLSDLFFSVVPMTQTHHQVIVSLLEKVVRIKCDDDASPVSSEFNKTDVWRLLLIFESIVDSATRFSEYGVISRSGITRSNIALILSTYKHLIGLRQRCSRSNYISKSLIKLLPKLGFGVCAQQSILEESTSINLDGFLHFKSSRANLPHDYMAISCTDASSCNSVSVRVNFDKQLFMRYLQWPCHQINSEMCSGICLSSSQIHLDVLWQGREFSSLHKTHLLHITLLHPLTGTLLNIQNSSKIIFTFPLTVLYSDISNLVCVLWEQTSLSWRGGHCLTEINVLSSSAVCQCLGLESEFYSVVERCPKGYYGDGCNLSKSLRFYNH